MFKDFKAKDYIIGIIFIAGMIIVFSYIHYINKNDPYNAKPVTGLVPIQDNWPDEPNPSDRFSAFSYYNSTC